MRVRTLCLIRLVVPAVLGGLFSQPLQAQTKARVIIIEAESYGAIVPHMSKVVDAAASGGLCVQGPPRGGRVGADEMLSDPGYAAYRLRLPVGGNYTLWGRCWWSGGGCNGCNSFSVKVDAQPVAVMGQDGTYRKWHWVKGPRVPLTAGEHVIQFRVREAEGKLDQFLLVDSPGYVPVRAEAETPEYLARPAERQK